MTNFPQIFPAPSGGAITGEIRAFVGSLPFGWLECDGSAFDAAKYPRLKTVLGAAVLPDLRDASLRGATASAAVNTKSGSNNPAVPVPAHNHITDFGNNDDVVNSVPNPPFLYMVKNTVTVNGTGATGLSLRSAVKSETFRAENISHMESNDAGTAGATLDVRGSSYYVKFAIYAL